MFGCRLAQLVLLSPVFSPNLEKLQLEPLSTGFMQFFICKTNLQFFMDSPDIHLKNASKNIENA